MFIRLSADACAPIPAKASKTRYAKGLSVRKAAEELQVNRGVIERRQAALIDAFSQLLYERDQADGACRLRQTSASLDEETETE